MIKQDDRANTVAMESVRAAADYAEESLAAPALVLSTLQAPDGSLWFQAVAGDIRSPWLDRPQIEAWLAGLVAGVRIAREASQAER